MGRGASTNKLGTLDTGNFHFNSKLDVAFASMSKGINYGLTAMLVDAKRVLNLGPAYLSHKKYKFWSYDDNIGPKLKKAKLCNFGGIKNV